MCDLLKAQSYGWRGCQSVGVECHQISGLICEIVHSVCWGNATFVRAMLLLSGKRQGVKNPVTGAVMAF